MVTKTAPGSQAALMLRDRARKLLAREVSCRFDRRFRNAAFVEQHRGRAREILHTACIAPWPGETPLAALIGSGWRDVALLTPDDERSLFIAFNALRCQANSLRSQINPRRPSRARLDRLEAVLAEAEEIRRHLVEANVRLVVSVAGRLSDDLNPIEDLCSEGLVILLKAVDGFDFARGYRFSTYATNSLQRHFFRLRKRAARKRRLGQPTPDDILGSIQGTNGVGLPADDPVQIARKLTKSAGRRLDPRERRILKLRFGLNGEEPLTLREIAGLLKISKERVRQVLSRAIEKLQETAERLRIEWTPRELSPVPREGV